MTYLLNILLLIKNNVKVELWQEPFVSYIQAVIAPLQGLNDTFAQFADDINYKLSFNGQTVYLEHYLNDQYDDVLRRIWIENTSNTSQAYIYLKAELQPKLFVYKRSEGKPPLYLFGSAEPLFSTHFIVHVPDDITYVEVIMRAQIDQYRIAGKIYEIQTFPA